MADRYIFRGKAVYPMLTQPDSYLGKEFWKIGVNLDKPSQLLFKKSGLNLTQRSLDNFDYNPFVVFKRPTKAKFKGKEIEMGPPAIKGWNPDEVTLGNGSDVEVVVEVYSTRYRNKGHRLLAVKALNVIPYEGNGEGPVVHKPEDVESEVNSNESDYDDIPF